MAITIGDLEAALAALRLEIPGQITTAISSLRTEIGKSQGVQNDTMRAEADTKFESASEGFLSEQKRLNDILQGQHSRLTELVDSLSAEVRDAVLKVSAVSEGKLDQVATAIL